MKIARYAAALVLALAMTIPMAGAIRLVKPTPPKPAEEAETAETVEPAAAVSVEMPKEPEPAAAQEADWNLLLVNPWNTLPEDFSVELVTLASCGLKVDKRIRADLNEMFSACQAAGLRPLICSAYRTQAVQTRLYNNKISRLRAAGYSRESAVEEAGRWVAVPGTSEHQTGLALDIVSSSYQALTKKQETTAEQKWLMEHCWEYGFILRYPSDKSEITGINYEPWHYRYVGKEAALAMRDSGQCLEEYLESLEKDAAQTGTSPRVP
ncbi:M15 family metallopeptidase [Oscillospiraceae bacterium 50-60]